MKIFFNLYFLLTLLLLLRDSIQLCNEQICPRESGECINDLCLCAPGYTTFYNNEKDYKGKQFCNYAYIYKDWAIWFELCLPFGVGHFYARRYVNGIMKFILFWFLSFVKVIFKKTVRGYPDLLKISHILLWVFGILYVVDYFGFTFDFYLDGNNMKML